MKRKFTSFCIRVPFGPAVIKLGASWLVIIPLVVWVVGAVYLPILGQFLSFAESWVLAAGITLLILASLAGHVWGHAAAARAVGSCIPTSLPLYPFGDAAQIWPSAPSARRELLVAVSGPLVSLLLAGLTYLLWDAQLHPYLNLSMFLLAFFNLGVAAINFTPAFPLDGGRLLRSVGWGLLKRPAGASWWGLRLGYLMVALLAGWGIILIIQQARFSWQTGSATLAVAGLLLVGLSLQPAWVWNRPTQADQIGVPGIWVRALIAGVLILAMFGVTLSLVPTNSGLEAPGYAVSVEPMVYAPAEYVYPSTGSFILTSVIPQTPITAGQWVYGKLNPVINIVPPERIVPADRSVQELAQEQYQMLTESEKTAVAVGLRLAGYPVEIKGEGARVVSILPESPAQNVLRPGDVIIGLNSEPIATTPELIGGLAMQDPLAVVRLQIRRDGASTEVSTPLMPPVSEDGPPRLGITVESAGFNVKLPFPVEIVPQKISGGPSAGLMFTLTVYNLLTPGDLTGGRRIAGTGTIDPEGIVGIIGGVELKVAAAEEAGASYFLAPPANYEDARAVARDIQVVEVATAEEAIDFLRSLPPLVE